MPADISPPIRVLEDHVCNQIAAGEVIERPASVFKELVENAVDAGADDIRVEVLQGGRKAVMVTDNGVGMDRDNCLLALERHATSKIRDAADIEEIRSMGFRGEALAAITSVSRFLLESRTAEALAGTQIRVEGSKLLDVSEAGCPAGTRIEVRDLFFNVPARRKFLRTEATELAYIRTLFHTFALAHPDVGLRLTVDSRLLEQLPPQAHLADRIADIHGQDLMTQLRPVDLRRGDIHVHGFVGLPTLHRGDRRDQVTLINRRPATAPILGYAIREAYAGSLPSGRHAVLFLHLDLPAGWVDVNVHPTKREVRFGPSHLIRDTLIEAITQALRPGEPGGVSGASADPPPPEARGPALAPEHRQDSLPEPGHTAYPPLPPPLLAQPPVSPENPASEETPPPAPTATAPRGPSSWAEARYLGELGRLRLLQLEDGVVLLHPRGAHERILYDQACREWDTQSAVRQQLLFPETVPCSPEEARRIREQLPDLDRLGFSVAEFGDNHFLVEAVPGWMEDVPAAEPLLEIASDTEGRRPSSARPDPVRDRLARRCCRVAAAHRRSPTPEDCLHLLQQLSACDLPYTTPFGKPTLLFLGREEYYRKFGIG